LFVARRFPSTGGLAMGHDHELGQCTAPGAACSATLPGEAFDQPILAPGHGASYDACTLTPDVHVTRFWWPCIIR
jgi:hypothetical protein